MIHPRAKLLADLSALGFLLQGDLPLDAGRKALVLTLLDSVGFQLGQTKHQQYFVHEFSVAVRSALGLNFVFSTLASALQKGGVENAESLAWQTLMARCRESLNQLRNMVFDEPH